MVVVNQINYDIDSSHTQRQVDEPEYDSQEEGTFGPHMDFYGVMSLARSVEEVGQTISGGLLS
jgi:hypothetical protein